MTRLWEQRSRALFSRMNRMVSQVVKSLKLHTLQKMKGGGRLGT